MTLLFGRVGLADTRAMTCEPEHNRFRNPGAPEEGSIVT
jgi:hypothetical protein